MPNVTRLETQWRQLMALCESETTFRASGEHPRLLKIIAFDIEQLAREMGFSPRRIASRDFRARRAGDRILGIMNEE